MVAQVTDPFPQLVATLIGVEGGYSNDATDKGGETIWGITVAVARAYGYTGAMRDMPRPIAVFIYRARYWTSVRFNDVYAIDAGIGIKLFDIGVNMGQATAGGFLQRALNSLNNGGTDYADMRVDGAVGNITLYCLKEFIAKRGDTGRAVLLLMIRAQHSVRYIELAEAAPSQEKYEYGWQAQRALA